MVSRILDEEIPRLSGISTGKSGFVAQLFGFSSVPTLDAVAMNAWITGKGSVEFSEDASRRDQMAAAAKEWISDKSLAEWLRDELARGYEQLRSEGFAGTQDIDPRIFQNIMHHWLWDRAKGDLSTTHVGMHRAMAPSGMAAPDYEVMYHGTAGDFDRMEPGQGVLGRGLYLTTDARSASGYATNAAMQRARRTSQDVLSGHNVRPIRVPNTLNLLDLTQDEDRQHLLDGVEIALNDWYAEDYDAVTPGRYLTRLQRVNASTPAYDALQTLDSFGQWDRINAALSDAGYDGYTIPEDIDSLTYHEQTLIFPESMDKVSNDLSGQPRGMAAPDWDTSVSPERFIELRDRNKRGGFLAPITPEDMADKRLYVKGDEETGFVGFALADMDNRIDVENVFNVPGESGNQVRGGAVEAMLRAVELGGTTLDNYDGFLTQYYHQFGFVETGRVPFNREYAPSNWDYENGEPDVVLMHRTGFRPGDTPDAIRERLRTNRDSWPTSPRGRIYDEWDDAAAERDRLIESRRAEAVGDGETKLSSPERGADAGAGPHPHERRSEKDPWTNLPHCCYDA